MTNRADRLIFKFSAALVITVAHTGTLSAACSFAVQGEGRVTGIVDARTFRLDDGREVRLAGIETDLGQKLARGSLKLETLIGGRDVTLRAGDDKPVTVARSRSRLRRARKHPSRPSCCPRVRHSPPGPSPTRNVLPIGWLRKTAPAKPAGGFGAVLRPQKTRKCPAIFWQGKGSLPSLKEQFCRRGRPGRHFTSISDRDGHGTLP